MASKDFGEPSSSEAVKKFTDYMSQHHLIIDGIFGFPFTG
jgi:NAD(P)H-hydrate repair Nnr-like enzyme with NAD(P)H-hydrate epimerase domain